MSAPPITEFKDDSLHLAYAGSLIFINWRTEFNPDHISKIEALHERRTSHYEAGIIGFNVIESNCALPSPEARRLGNEMMGRTRSTTRAVVMVMLDQGFAASALQSIALRVLGLGGRVPIRNFRAVEPAAEWVHFEYPEAPPPKLLVDLVTAVRRE